jgi:hypothetical protein
VNAVSAGLFISALGSCLVTICGVVYLLEVRLPGAKYTCPFLASASCPSDLFCNYCNPGDTTPNQIINVLKLPKCISNVSFSADSPFGKSIPQSCLNLPCSASALQCLPSMGDLCGSCSAINFVDKLTVYLSIAMFPLAVLFMTCNLMAWRKQSRSEIPQSSLELKLGNILKWMSIANVFVKYLLASSLFFIIVGGTNKSPDSLLKCDAISGRFSTSQTKTACNPQIDRTLEVFVLLCCCVMFSCFLIFDVAIFARMKFKTMSTVIACTVSFGCFMIIIISGIQLKNMFDLSPTFVCSIQAAGSQFAPSSQSPPSTFQCDQDAFQKQTQITIGVSTCNCRVEFPAIARAAASTLVLDVLFVIFDSVVYAVACKHSPPAQPSLSGDYVSMKGL